MKKLFILAGIGVAFASASIIDSDLDGVPDSMDLCPNTPFLEIVNKNGCPITKSKKNKIKFHISAGYEFDNYKNSSPSRVIFSSLSAKKNNFKLAVYYSQQNDGSGNGYVSNDLITSLYYYNRSIKDVTLKFGLKAYLPTDNNTDTDYAALVQGVKYFNNSDIGLSFKHKIYGETGTNAKETITLFSDFYYKKLAISPYAYTENSAYDSATWYKYAGVTLSYSFNKALSVSLDSSVDLEESTNYTLNGSVGLSF